MEGCREIASDCNVGEVARPHEEEESRRKSQSSDDTVSVKDSAESIPTLDVDITVEPGPVSCCSESVGLSRSSSSSYTYTFDWTKKFQSLVEEAPLLEARLENGLQVQAPVPPTHFGFDKEGREKTKEDYEGHKKMECDWLDLELLEEGREFVRRNFFAVLLAHFIGIAFLLTVRPIQSLLLRTSALHRKENTLRRYVKLILYLKKFYDSPKDIVTKSEKEICYIHRVQRNAARNYKVYVPPPWDDLKLSTEEQLMYQAIQEDTKQLDSFMSTKHMPKILFTVNPDVPMSQYDLVVIQYAFYGLLAEFPRVFGIYGKYDRQGQLRGLNGFIHLWACIGHLLGIEERFNMCLPRNYDPETNRLILRHVFLYSFKNISESGMRLWRCMTSGSSRYFFFFRTKAMILFMCKDVAQLENCKNIYSLMKPAERFCYYWYKFLIHWILWVPPFRIMVNSLTKLSVRICQYFVIRQKKCESKWEMPTNVCVIDPIVLKESDRKQSNK